MKMFSAFAASTLLERDRQTVARALRSTAPDGTEKGQPRWKLATIVAALERNSDSGTAVRTTTRTAGTAGRLNELADEIEHLHHQLDAAIAKVKSIPNIAAKQPHSRAAMKLIERIDELYTECNAILREIDPTSLAPYVTPGIVGSEFRELLSAIYGREVVLDGVRLFPLDSEQRDTR